MKQLKIKHCFVLFIPIYFMVYLAQIAQASEGMWLPAEQPDLVKDLPLKAVARIGGCSGVFVSETGLLLTNAHCIEDTMQLSSDAQYEIRKKGFLARTQAEELPASPGFFASITLSQEDVTAEVLQGVHDGLSPRDRYLRITRNRNKVLKQCEAEQADVRCQVQTHQDGLSFLLNKEKQFRDVRLVYVPPTSIALFGGEAANWQWPRFAADIAIMRVYVNASGGSADWDRANKPYQSSTYAQVADTHLTFFDTVRVAGYPGVTERFRTASEMQWAFSEKLPAKRTYLSDFERIIADFSEVSEEKRIKLQPVLFRLRNQISSIEAQIAGYQAHGMQQKSEEAQERLLLWLSSPERQIKYSGAWWAIQKQIQLDRYWLPQQLWWEFLQELSLPGAAILVHRFAYEQTLPEDIRARGFQARDKHQLIAQLENYRNRIEPELEQALLVYMLQRYLALPESLQSESILNFFQLHEASTPEKIQAKVAELYQHTRLLSEKKQVLLLERSLDEIENSSSPWLQLATQTAKERLAMDARAIESLGRVSFARPRMIEARKSFDQSQGRIMPANANRTLRVSEGQIRGYRPSSDPDLYRLGLTYLDVFNEYVSIIKDHSLPKKFRKAMIQHGKGCFTNRERGSVMVNFISTADGTLGSSGSPTFDDQGRLIGVVFDQMDVSAMSDWIYERDRHRMIHVDIRYLLWILIYYEDAHELLAELGFNSQADRLTQGCRRVKRQS